MIRYTNKIGSTIHFVFQVNGQVQEPDVVGSILSITASFIPEYSCTKLQNSGKIGKIKVNLEHKPVKNVVRTIGTIELDSNMDSVDNGILVAIIENIKKVHLHQAQIKFHHRELVEKNNYTQVFKRALQLCAVLDQEGGKAKDLRQSILEVLSSKKMSTYKQFTMGSKFKDTTAVFVVEGRKDVQALLNANFHNCVGLGGYYFNQADVFELLKNKAVTVFVDGDSGGAEFLKKLAKVVNLEYVINIKDHTDKLCVQQLTPKEVIQCIKNRKVYIES